MALDTAYNSDDSGEPIQRTLALPTGLTGGDFAAMPVQLGDKFGMTASPLDLLPALDVGQVTYFVDKLRGDNANDGLTEATPFKDLDEAMDRSDVGTCWVAPGIYENDKGWKGGDMTLPIDAAYAVRRWDNGRPGRVIISSHQQSLTAWTASPNNAALWRNALPACAGVVDPLAYNEDGSFRAYYKYDLGNDTLNAAACALHAGSFYVPTDTTNRVDVNPVREGEPQEDELILLANLPNVREESRRSFYCEGLTFVGGLGAFRCDNLTGIAGGRALFENCDFMSSPGYGLLAKGFDLVYVSNCRALSNATDGFQYFWSGVFAGDFIHYNCQSDNNGFANTADTANGYSVHNTTRALHVNSTAKGNRGPQFADTIDTQAWWVNCTAGRSRSVTQGGNSAGFNVLETAKGWAYRCVSMENYDDFSGAVSSTSAQYDQCLFQSVNNATTYTQT